MTTKRLIAALIASVTAVCALPSVYAEKAETVTLIVEAEGDPLLTRRNAEELSITEFNETDTAEKARNEIYSVQSYVEDEIGKAVPSAEKGYVYTYLMNGFSVEVPKNDVDKIRSLPGVKNVYVSGSVEINDHETAALSEDDIAAAARSCCEFIGADHAHENGLSGEGRVIAIIDSAFDVNHEMFADPVENPRYSKEDIDRIISKNSFDNEISANRVYHSSKIPFACSYINGSSAVLPFSSISNHGQHVAGIAAGKNGRLPDGTLFSGVAPEAQLVLMRTVNDDMKVDLPAVIKAIDDAAKLDVDAINLSLGADSQFYDPAYDKAITAAQNAGIFVAAAAGNAAKGTNHDLNSTSVLMIDSSTSGTPATVHSSTAVASMQMGSYIGLSNILSFNGGERNAEFDSLSMRLELDKISGSEFDYIYIDDNKSIDYEALRNKILLLRMQDGDPDWDKIAAAGIKALVVVDSDNDEIRSSNDYANQGVRMNLITARIADHTAADYLKEKPVGTAAVAKSGTVNETETEMAKLSSWGANATLELKPDITAPGENIYSSVFDNRYAMKSGTSMATPHLAGLAVLTRQYIDREYPDFAGNKAQLAENMLMSSSVILEKNGIPYSPRYQGAGAANMKNMMSSPVILLGDGGEKSKLSLKEIEDSFTLRFTAKNLGGTPVTFDRAELSVITDGVTDNEGVTCIGDSRALKWNAQLPQNITVPANGTQDIEFTVSLDKDELDKNSEIFQNGFFVEGFASLVSDSESIAPVHIPFMGFYGGWTSQHIFDYTTLSGKSFLGYTGLTSQSRLGTGISLGENFLNNDAPESKYNSEEFAGYSPNGDGNMDILKVRVSPLRTVEDNLVQIFDEKGNIIADGLKLISDEYKDNGSYVEKYDNAYLEYDERLPDGNYTVRVSGRLPYERAQTESFEMRFYTDTVRPRFEKYLIREEGGKKYLDLAASDNKHLAGFRIKQKGQEEFEAQGYPAVPSTYIETTIDITDMDIETVTVFDYAGNSAEYSAFPFIGEVLGCNTYGSAASVGARIISYEQKSITADIVAAAYDNDGRLISAAVKKAQIKPDMNDTVLSLENMSGSIGTIRLTAFDSANNLAPLMPAVSYDPNKKEEE